MAEAQPKLEDADVSPVNDLPHSALYVLAAAYHARPVEASEPCPSGREVKAVLQQAGFDINHGVLYPRLDNLVDEGYAERLDGPDRRSNAYRVTERGRDLLASLSAFFSL